VQVRSGAARRMIEEGRRDASSGDLARVSEKEQSEARYLTEETPSTASHEEIA
jgi:hypothetical protein